MFHFSKLKMNNPVRFQKSNLEKLCLGSAYAEESFFIFSMFQELMIWLVNLEKKLNFLWLKTLGTECRFNIKMIELFQYKEII